MKITNLGRVLTILARAEATEYDYHADIRAFHAPSECHAHVSRGEAKRARLARKHAEAVARAPLRVIERQARARGGLCLGMGPRWRRLVSHLVTHPDLTGGA